MKEKAVDSIRRLAKALTDSRSTGPHDKVRSQFIEEWGAMSADNRANALVDPLVFSAARSLNIASSDPRNLHLSRLSFDLDTLIDAASEMKQKVDSGTAPSMAEGVRLVEIGAQAFSSIPILYHLSLKAGDESD